MGLRMLPVEDEAPGAKERLRYAAVTAAAAGALWWSLNARDTAWVWMGAAMAAAAVLGWGLAPAHYRRWRLKGLLRFVPYLLWNGLRGGTAVALIALQPRLPLAPAIVEYRLRVTHSGARLLLAGIVNLLPGTLTLSLNEGRLCVHVLDARRPIHRELAELEGRIADLYGLELAPEPRDG